MVVLAAPELIIDTIMSGQVDDEMNEIIETINTRRSVIAFEAKALLKIGQRVRFNDQGRTNRFTGMTGVITKKLQKNIVVELDEQDNLGEPLGSVRTHPSLIDVIEE